MSGAVALSVPLGVPSAVPVQPTVGAVTAGDLASHAVVVPSQHTIHEPTAPTDAAHTRASGVRTRSGGASHTRSTASSNASIQRSLSAPGAASILTRATLAPGVQDAQTAILDTVLRHDEALAAPIAIGAALPCGASATVACRSTIDSDAAGEHACAILNVRACKPRGYEALTHFAGFRTCDADIAWQTASSIRLKAPALRSRVAALIAAMTAGTTCNTRTTVSEITLAAAATPAPAAAAVTAEATQRAQPSETRGEQIAAALGEAAQAGEDISRNGNAASTSSEANQPQGQSDAAQAQSDLLRRVHHVEVSGLHNLCFPNAIARSFGVHGDELKEVATDTLRSIDDPTTLARYGLSVEPDATASALQAAKEAYLTSKNTCTSAWGGTLEMHLLSHARGGTVAFRVVDSVRQRTVYVSSLPEGHADTRTEIPVQHCDINGASRPDVRPNHWNAFEYEAKDGTRSPAWHHLHTESAVQKAHRIDSLLQAAAEADRQKRAEVRYREQISAALVARLAEVDDGDESDAAVDVMSRRASARRTRVAAATSAAAAEESTQAPPAAGTLAQRVSLSCSPPGAANNSPVRRHQSALAGSAAVGPRSHRGSTHSPRVPAAALPPTQRRLTFSPASPSRQGRSAPLANEGATTAGRHGTWRARKVSILQQLTPISAPVFVGVVTQLLERYRELSNKRQYVQCQDVVHMLLDYPADALRAGGSAQERRSWLQNATDAMEQRLHALTAHPATVESNTATETSTVPPQSAIGSMEEKEGEEKAEEHAHEQLREVIDVSSQPDDSSQLSPKANAPHIRLSESLPSEELLLLRAAALQSAVLRAKTILNQGGPRALQRAAKALRSGQLAECNQRTFRQLNALHPRGGQIGRLPAHRAAEIGSLEKVLPRVIKQLDNGSAPGVSGWNGSHLAAVWAGGTKEARDGLHLMLRDLCNGIFSGECRKRLLACRLIPLEKNDGGVRPIAIGELFAKAAAHCAVALVKEDTHRLFPRIQYGVQRTGGSETASHLIRNLLRDYLAKHPGQVCAIKLDFRNAFNTLSRKLAWETLLKHDCLSSMLKPFYAQYAEPTELLVYDRNRLVHKLLSSEGVRQGDPFAAFVFALTVQPLYEAALKQAREGCADGVSIQDDFTVVGTYGEAMKVFDYVKERSLREFGLELRVDKCEVYLPPETQQAASEPEMRTILEMCATRRLRVTHQMESLGVQHGTEEEIARFCEEATDSCEFFFEALEHPDLPLQHASLLLRNCQLPRLGYVARTAHPDQLAAAAQRFDERALRCWQKIHGNTDKDLTILAQETECGDATCTMEQLVSRISLPVSCGGMGLRRVQDTMHAAYLASALEALPELLRLRLHLRVGAAGTGDDLPTEARSSVIFHELAELQQHLRAHGTLNRRLRRAVIRTPIDTHLEEPERSATAAVPTTTTQPTPSPHALASPSSPSAVAAASANRTISSSHAVLKKDTEDVWRAASRKAAKEHLFAAPFPLARKLQRELTKAAEEMAADALITECKPFQVAIMQELRHAPQSGAWLTALPSRRAYRLTSEQYQLATRKRLGMLPDRSLRHDACTACHGRNRELPQLSRDPHHAEACVRHTGRETTQRHNLIVGVITELARSVGATVRIRQPALGDAIIGPKASAAAPGPRDDDDASACAAPIIEHSNKRGDLLILMGAEQIMVDVTVPRITAATHLTEPANRTAGQCTLAAEQLKLAKYQSECELRGQVFVPFVVESHGGVGPLARKLLTRLAGRASERTAQDFLSDALTRISVALQRGNALILQQGMQQLRRDQLSLCGGGKRVFGGRLVPASRSRQQRAGRTFDAGWDNAGVAAGQQLGSLHANLRAGGGLQAAHRYQAAHVEVAAA